MIRLENIKKEYAGRRVLDIPSLILEEGRSYAVIGPNGAGKTTLLRILAGTLPPSGGEVSIPAALRDAAGYMPQRPYAYGVSVFRNVLLALPKGDKAANEQLATSALQKVGLGALARAKGDRLSGGEAQRMAIARMIVRPRRLLLLDEPASAMDVAGNELVEGALKAYCQRHGCTLVFSTHSLGQASRLADSILVMDHGRIAEQGAARDVLYHAQSEQARAFIRYWRVEEADSGAADSGATDSGAVGAVATDSGADFASATCAPGADDSGS